MVLSKQLVGGRSGSSTPCSTTASCATLSEELLDLALSSDEEDDLDDPTFYDVTIEYVASLEFAVVKVCKTCCHCSALSCLSMLLSYVHIRLIN